MVSVWTRSVRLRPIWLASGRLRSLRLRSVWPGWRVWLALGLLLLGYQGASFADHCFQHLVHSLLRLRSGPPHMLGQNAYAVSMVGRLLWNVLLFNAVCAALGRSPAGFPIRDRRSLRHSLLGLGTGLLVMTGVIAGICATGAAGIALSGQSLGEALGNGGFWLLFDAVGAAGEELFARGTLLLVAERLVGWRGAVFASGILFFMEHTGNPGASTVWLLRLFLQGILLAYAVYHTGSLWWSAGYHAGWNWVSAPLFGAAGSGYLDQNHILDFLPRGPNWITGGAVGPEGSVFAFVAVVLAFGLLLFSTGRSRTVRHPRRSTVDA